MGGVGSGFAHDADELRRIAGSGLTASPTTEVLIEESVLGWKEYELEVMRDKADNVVIVCSIENLDPMGVHTGDSITVAPAMTLTDREYQAMRDVAIAVIRAVGVDTGGCNIQFAINPDNGRLIVIEMNPRVSRSSALASKATGFPIAKIAAKVAVGYTLDEIPNDITAETPASFEPSLDYVVVKAPRFAFEKFPTADSTLTTHMKSVGEAMAIGRNFTEALGKALRSLEDDKAPFDFTTPITETLDELLVSMARPHDGRLGVVMKAYRLGATPAQLFEATKIDPWFLDQLQLIFEVAERVRTAPELTADILRLGKRHGLADTQIAKLRNLSTDVIRGVRWALGVRPVYKTVDTCAAEFAAHTPYHYSTYDEETEVQPRTKPAVLILGSGPNRIGQGIEFDYSCVHAAMALREAGYEAVMVNCNPETVSTDYDTSDRLYFEPLTLEDVLEVYHAEAKAGPVAGVIVQLGGQTPLKLAQALKDAGVPIVGTPPEAINLAEERGAFGKVLEEAGLTAPAYGMATSAEHALDIAHEIGYPVLVRPSYVLGGRGMEIVYDDASLAGYIERATDITPSHPVLVDRFLDDAIEIDVDALYDGTELYLGGVMEHIEEAGIHSGDSACSLPPITLGNEVIDQIRVSTEAIARGVGVRGLLNIQFALLGDTLYVLEANPRASRTVPFVSKATDTPLAKAATRISMGTTIARAAGRGHAAHRHGRHRDAAQRTDRREGSRDAVQPVPHRRRLLGRHAARPGDEVHRRGDGARRDLRHGLRQEPGRLLRRRAHQRHRVRLRRQPRQAARHLPGEAARRPRLQGAGHRGHRAGAAPPGRGRDRDPQGVPGPRPERGEDGRAGHPRRGGRPDLQHPARCLPRRQPAPRRLGDPLCRDPRRRAVRDHRPGPVRLCAGHRGAGTGDRRGAVAAGVEQGRARRTGVAGDEVA